MDFFCKRLTFNKSYFIKVIKFQRMEIIARTQVNKYLSLSSPVNVRKVEEKKQSRFVKYEWKFQIKKVRSVSTLSEVQTMNKLYRRRNESINGVETRATEIEKVSAIIKIDRIQCPFSFRIRSQILFVAELIYLFRRNLVK